MAMPGTDARKAGAALAVVIAFAAPGACAQRAAGAEAAADYPARPIRMIVPATPGGGTDILARLFAQRFAEAYSQQVVVDNRGGGGGIIGTELVARASPDGHTLLMAFTSHAINPGLYRKLPYDTLNDFAAIALAATVPNILVVHPGVPVRTVEELVAYVKARPGKVTFASSGTGSSSHLAGVLFARMAGLDMAHIPYKGGAPAQADVMGGQVTLTFANMQSAIPHVRGGRLRGIATSGARRSAAAPDVPTLDESGLKGYEANSWFGLFTAARVPAPIVTKLNAEVLRSLQVPEVKERMAAQGAEPIPMTAPEFGQFVRAEVTKWARVVKEAGARVD
jgi:tripartite-type tricarboxylate transporter receptor subunit TctC